MSALEAGRHESADHTAPVRCDGLTKRFGSVTAVQDASFELASGEILALLGPSGCGKTTLLRLIAGFERPDHGRVELAGRVASDARTFIVPEQRRVGLVFQDYALFPHLTVERNVGYGVRGRRTDRRAEVVRALELVGLQGYEERHPHELSGGEQQRVALARALAPGPDVVLMDEPFSNLDAALRTRVRSEVREILHAAGTAAILVTHDQEEALSLADRVAVMNAGRIRQIDTPELVYTRPADAFVAAFVGGANLLTGRAEAGAVSCPLGTIRPPHRPDAQEVTLVVRPESLRLRPDPSARAVVESMTFYGHDQVVHVRLSDGTPVRVRTAPGRFFDAGDHVAVDVVEDEVVVFEAPSTAPGRGESPASS